MYTDQNLPPNYDYLNDELGEHKEDMPDSETDETYLEVDDSIIDRSFRSNVDLGDEHHFPDTQII